MKSFITAFAFIATLIGCPGLPPKPPNPNGPNPPCAEYCDRVGPNGLKCKQGMPTKKGASCLAVCENVQGSGFAELDLRCIMQAQSCSEIDLCER